MENGKTMVKRGKVTVDAGVPMPKARDDRGDVIDLV